MIFIRTEVRKKDGEGEEIFKYLILNRIFTLIARVPSEPKLRSRPHMKQ